MRHLSHALCHALILLCSYERIWSMAVLRINCSNPRVTRVNSIRSIIVLIRWRRLNKIFIKFAPALKCIMAIFETNLTSRLRTSTTSSIVITTTTTLIIKISATTSTITRKGILILLIVRTLSNIC